MAAGAATFRNPPSAHNISSSPTTRLPVKAPTITSGRLVRSIMKFPEKSRSEAGRDAGRDGLEKHRGSIVDPKLPPPEQTGDAEGSSARSDSLPDPPRWLDRCGDLLRRRERPG